MRECDLSTRRATKSTVTKTTPTRATVSQRRKNYDELQ